ncbi:MAG: hypothetical protein N3B21_16160 [Clostridia bacterium]|nr:hypothetical protein [Clostridia bacterium]
MDNVKLSDILKQRDVSVTLENVLDNSRAHSGGHRDVNFLKLLIENKLLIRGEFSLKRTAIGVNEEYYLERYKKMRFETDRHFLCRTIIQEELKKFDIETFSGLNIGNMDILRCDSSYDITTEDFNIIIDVGLTPARNYFRGLTDLKVKNYLITTFFDDYMDDIIFCSFSRADDKLFLDALKDYQEGFKLYTPNPQEHFDERMYYND